MSSIIAKVYTLNSPQELFLEEEVIYLDDIGVNEIVAETIYSVVSPGTETAAYRGLSSLRPGKIYPRLVGYCNLSKIVAIGNHVLNLSIGDIILTFQSHRSHFKCSKNDFFIKLSGGKIKQYTPAYLYHLGYNALLTAKARSGHNIGIIGAGVLGYTSAIMSDIAGAKTFVFSNQQYASAKLSPKGIYCFDKNENCLENINKITSDTGIDIIINTSNTWGDWLLALQIINKGGTIINLGFPGRGESLPSFNPLDPQYVYAKHITIKALCPISEINNPIHEIRFNMRRNMEYIIHLIVSGKINTDEIITGEIHFSMLQDLYEQYIFQNSYRLTTLINWKN